MPKKRKLRSLDDKCRVCLSDEGCMSDIFGSDLKLKIDDLGKSTSIDIEDDETFPRNICHVCLYKLDMWIDFKKQFISSNNMLQEHLELGELSDNKASLAKRKHSELQICGKDNTDEQGNAKKHKSDASTPSSVKSVSLKLEITRQSNLNDEQVAIKDSQSEVPDDVKLAEVKEDSEITSDVIPIASTVSAKVKQIVGRRAKTTERRKESTRRWVARKKALLAATGENDTDTDSVGSDDDQLSPVQKARAKGNAEKVAESHRKMTRALQNLDSNISAYYGTNADSESCSSPDSETGICTKHQRIETIRTNFMKNIKPGNGGVEVRLPSKNVPILPKISNIENSINSTNVANNFVPHSLRSELIIDGANFAITSTLVISEPHYLNPTQSNNSSLPADEANQERNTDIIDAVQLRRVSPKDSHSKNENKFVDTCLRIEVEGTELEALQRVQEELASFIERDMKMRIMNANSDEQIDGKSVDGFQSLEQQLKTIVEKTIKKNLENSRAINNRGNNTFTGEFLKAALRSKIFQPCVLLDRYDRPKRLDPLEQKTRKRKPVVKHIEKKMTRSLSKKNQIFAAPLGKRRSIQPAKYADYNTSPFDSDSEENAENETAKPQTSGSKSSKVKTYGSAGLKTTGPVATQQKSQQSLLLPSKTPTAEQKPNNAVNMPATEQKPESAEKTQIKVANNSTGEKHICGVCGVSFGTRKEVEAHFATHKKQTKQKMMRCKRCHEIVDARYVKMHVCSASKNSHKCQNCDATFRTEQLLARHAESHELRKEEQIDNTTTEAEINPEEVAEFSKISASNEKHVSFQVATDNNKNSYTCFVCDKTFTDEELLKDHLQKHCDDMSEDERSNVKEYQCAICGESLESEDALETHVEKHLYDDEDDNPNLISIGTGDGDNISVKTKMLHSCGQCSDTFDSEMLLMLHMQAHEEEVAIAEWERRGIDNSQEEQHICVICDDLFATEDELSEHLDVHNDNPHICLLCDKPFLTLEELQCHVNTH